MPGRFAAEFNERLIEDSETSILVPGAEEDFNGGEAEDGAGIPGAHEMVVGGSC